jgi:P-type E1-E2 ATPase
VIGWIAGRDPTRFLAVLVIATPCPLLLAIPVAIIGAISLAAGRAIVIKNPAMLERVSKCSTVIFDKTGTLTYGRPALTAIHCAPGMSPTEALRFAAAVEQYSRHPLAEPIVAHSRRESITLPAVTKLTERPGEGLTAQVEDRLVHITGRAQILQQRPMLSSVLPPAAPGLECILLVDGDFIAAFTFRDAPREESKSFIRHLLPKHQVSRIILLSGDRQPEVEYLANEVGISEAQFGKSPEEKVDIVRAAAQRGPTLFVGDGINDAPAMQAATVGVAFGQPSDITAEASDAVVLEPSLTKVDELIHIGRRMRRIALQSAVGGMGVSMVGMLIAAAGFLPPVAGAIVQEIIDVAAVMNALRVALPSRELQEEAR